MARLLDWLVSTVIGALVVIAAYRAIFDGQFAPFPLAAGVSLLLLVRIAHQHAPKWIAAKYRRK